MKVNKFLMSAALVGAFAFALPVYAHAEDHSMESGAKEMYHGAKQDVKDTAITTKVKTSLSTNPVTKGSTIHVETDDGVVTLTGDVPTMEVAAEAVQVAGHTERVKQVRNEMKVASAVTPGSRPADGM